MKKNQIQWTRCRLWLAEPLDNCMPIEELERKKQLFINTLLNDDREQLEN